MSLASAMCRMQVPASSPGFGGLAVLIFPGLACSRKAVITFFCAFLVVDRNKLRAGHHRVAGKSRGLLTHRTICQHNGTMDYTPSLFAPISMCRRALRAWRVAVCPGPEVS